MLDPYSVVFVLLVSRFSQNYCKIHGINAYPYFTLCGRPAQCIYMHASMSSTSKLLIKTKCVCKLELWCCICLIQNYIYIMRIFDMDNLNKLFELICIFCNLWSSTLGTPTKVTCGVFLQIQICNMNVFS